jgi:hypothetical protein
MIGPLVVMAASFRARGNWPCVLSDAELSNMVFSYLSIQGVDFSNLLF